MEKPLPYYSLVTQKHSINKGRNVFSRYCTIVLSQTAATQALKVYLGRVHWPLGLNSRGESRKLALLRSVAKNALVRLQDES